MSKNKNKMLSMDNTQCFSFEDVSGFEVIFRFPIANAFELIMPEHFIGYLSLYIDQN